MDKIIKETMVSIADIIEDPKLMMRVKLDETIIKLFLEALKNGIEFPPIELMEVEKRLLLADGWHRIEAHRRHKLKKIKSHVSLGTWQEAVLAAVRANAYSPLRRSNKDKEKCVLALLNDPEWQQRSSAWIATQVGISPHTVERIKSELGEIDQPGNCQAGLSQEPPQSDDHPVESLQEPSEPPEPQKLVGRDGKRYKESSKRTKLRAEALERRRRQEQRRDEERARNRPLGREEVDPDFKGSHFDYLSKYGHNPIMTAAERETEDRIIKGSELVAALERLNADAERIQGISDKLGQAGIVAWARRGDIGIRRNRLITSLSMITIIAETLKPVVDELEKEVPSEKDKDDHPL